MRDKLRKHTLHTAAVAADHWKEGVEEVVAVADVVGMKKLADHRHYYYYYYYYCLRMLEE